VISEADDDRVGGGKYGGMGGLSIRNVEKVKRVLRFQKRMDNTNSEDQWLSARLGLLPEANMCPREKEMEFAVAEVWHEWPTGYSLSPSEFTADVWEPHSKRQQILEYCPELRMILDMRLEREKCPDVPTIDLSQFDGLGEMSRAYVPSDEPPPESEDRDDLKKHIEELETQMEKLKAENAADGGDVDASDSDVAIGEPQIADFAHVADVKPADGAGANNTDEDSHMEDESLILR
jgi:hypothetical protein